jgi:hypothetical protein
MSDVEIAIAAKSGVLDLRLFCFVDMRLAPVKKLISNRTKK